MSRRRVVRRERMLLEHWATCDGTMAVACRWVLRKLVELERQNRDLSRALEAARSELVRLRADERIGRYLEMTRSLERQSSALIVKATETYDADEAD